MAAKRVSVSAINWTAFAERVPKQDLQKFQALKSKNDSYVRKVAASPDSLPKIDWNFYKTKVAVPGMVDSFQKAYESLQIPYPSDKGLIAKINEEESQVKKKLAELSAEIATKNEQLNKRLSDLESQIKFSEMTTEEFLIANPELQFNPENPTNFPHTKGTLADLAKQETESHH